MSPEVGIPGLAEHVHDVLGSQALLSFCSCILSMSQDRCPTAVSTSAERHGKEGRGRQKRQGLSQEGKTLAEVLVEYHLHVSQRPKLQGSWEK